ncbi:HIT family protein [Larsenimonas salina]|uniref:HIT family protein n=1 Tax=Larsenimonas salina TaxID=1295565 RepID=UPI002072ED83|nr:HIT family protein [Larsenimonas salina]MCM5704291.1 HIT family protein [Larsenimonas salina]
MTFTLDERLQADTHHLTTLALSERVSCQVRLFDDTRYCWLVFIPEHPECVELFELPDTAQQALWRILAEWGQCLKDHFNADKLNVASLGNLVPQFHVHLVLRFKQDPAWPGPVWGHSPAEPMTTEVLAKRMEELKVLLLP